MADSSELLVVAATGVVGGATVGGTLFGCIIVGAEAV